ncbi:hypothetical protein SO802_005145 [Lithocarpus litseifolius]|uniref:Ribosomal protein L34 n=1 Tax=Lithocarpus litseifolius TaxID=425828 RepID=A0AAW2DJU6_9ROSI
MASKTLARTGASLVNRFFSNPFLRQSPNPNRISGSCLRASMSLRSYSHRSPSSKTHSICLRRLRIPLWPPFSQLLLARSKATKGGRRVIARRIAKGRFRITA